MTNIDKKVAELFEAGCHLGHKDNRVHPKARKYIYSVENGVSVIDLTKTVPMLESAKEFMKTLAHEGKTILVVATKKIGAGVISKTCAPLGIAYVSLKWPAGLLTNFEMISKNVKKLESMREEKEKGEWNKFVKHEQVQLQKLLTKLEKFYGGILPLKKIPDALFIIDIKKEKNAATEAKALKIPVIAVVDTNVNPEGIDYPVPGNDDSLTSIEYFVKELIGAYTKGVPPSEPSK
jgi:small subunit ribosomal protein S2